MTASPAARRRWIVPVLAVAGILAAVAVVAVVTRGRQEQAAPVGIGSLPPASPGVVSADYVGSHWRLTTVADRRDTTEIPGWVDAWLELAHDGELSASDALNAISGHFTLTGAGFDVSDATTTLVGYAGHNPLRVAARVGIAAMFTRSPPLPSTASGPPQAQPVHVSVLSADREHLTVQANGLRLTFVQTGPARTPGTPLPSASSAPDH